MKIRNQGGRVVAISTDQWDQILFRQEQLGMGMIYLADPDMEVIETYGLTDATLGKDVARPASFILDAEGRILWRHLPTDWRLRMGGDAYMEVFDRFHTQGAP
jgi:peroxiredoxin